ncbi:MAG: ectonucleotide pyrophosphatase/phosphodiesterase [Acidobacteria bacterium]|nr:ectonucleotide pyrophosphatase/phosphodiesterase [Acidobacteriota bacterium]
MNKNRAEIPPRVVVVSADGMRPDFYRSASKFGLKIPNLRKLVVSGASADTVESVYPSTTYPAHATLVTGVLPRKHGIYSHLASLDPTDKARPWTWFARAIDVPTLWDVAEASGRKTAAVAWPVSAGARITYNIPEIWDPAAPNPHHDFSTAARHSTPHLFDEVLNALNSAVLASSGNKQSHSLSEMSADRLRTEAAIYIWKRYRPHLLLLHFADYDQAAHHCGPFGPEALAAVEKMDEEIGRICKAIKPDKSVTLVVLSDHGFVPVAKEASPLVALIEEGLLGRNAHGEPELKRLGAIHSGGSFAFYWLEEPTAEERRALRKAVARLMASGAVREVIDRKKLEALGADPDAELMLDAAPDFYFSDRSAGPMVQESVKDRGTHGHLPSVAGMEAGLVISGPGIKPAKNLGRISLTQIAPTLAARMGLGRGALASDAAPLDLS